MKELHGAKHFLGTYAYSRGALLHCYLKSRNLRYMLPLISKSWENNITRIVQQTFILQQIRRSM